MVKTRVASSFQTVVSRIFVRSPDGPTPSMVAVIVLVAGS